MANTKEYSRKKEGSEIEKIIVDLDLCIGAASCVAVSPDTFQLNSENKAEVLDPNSADDEAVKAAAQSCPTKAIILKAKGGSQVYP